MTDENPLFRYRPDRGVELPFPRPPEPDFDHSLYPELGPGEAETDPLLNLDGDVGRGDVQRHIREERFCFYTALGINQASIRKKLGVTPGWIYAAARNKELLRRIAYHRRQLFEKVKATIVKNLSIAMDKLATEHMEVKLPSKSTTATAVLRKKRHELEAVMFMIDKGLEFQRFDHAQQKLEEDIFGPRAASGGPMVQINQTTEQPTLSSRAVEVLISKLPMDQRKPVIDRLLERSEEIEAEIPG